jgi:CubicO group peptidase (beta-lactamase class C family)
LLYEFFKFNIFTFIREKHTSPEKYEVKPSSKPYKFKSNLQEDKYIDKQLNKTGLISYLRFEDENITIDKFTPEDRFGKFINKKTKLRANSVGKTMASYVVGHAICGGYIDSVNTKLNDWPLLENTLYYDQKLIDILNMNSGDQEYVFKMGDELRNVGSVSEEFKGMDDYAIDFKKYMSIFKNTKKSKPYFNYSSINPQLALNYVLFKTGNDFEKILENTFKKKSKIEDSIFFFRVPNSSAEKGDANIMFYATRYDYLRIGKAMLDDWQKDTCVGKYLKTLFENRISKETKKRNSEGRVGQYPYARGYAGQFQTHYEGIDKNRAVMGMHGYGGQRIVIDFERSRIIVTNALFENYNYKKIVYQVIKKGS